MEDFDPNITLAQLQDEAVFNRNKNKKKLFESKLITEVIVESGGLGIFVVLSYLGLPLSWLLVRTLCGLFNVSVFLWLLSF